MIFPEFLKRGDRVAIVSPASHINPDYVDGACRVLTEWGFNPVVGAHCKGGEAYYSGTVDERRQDLLWALTDSSVKAILCSRGGYGAVHLVEHVPLEMLRKNPKWIIGFSDISVLHAMMNAAGVASVHASMAKHLTLKGGDDPCSGLLRDLLTGVMPHYEQPAHPFNRLGTATGEIVGGNMAVLCGLISTNVDLLKRGKILFIEDVGEAIYKIERMLYNLRLAGVLPNLKGLIVGHFTECEEPDGNGETMNEMIRRMVAPYGYPVAFNFPIGHIDENVPIVEGATVSLSVAASGVELQF